MSLAESELDKSRGLNPRERAAQGKAARAATPRSSHAQYEPSADRCDPVSLLKSQDSDRATELLPIRYERMLASPFTFFRGAALLMAADLASTPRSGYFAQLCGDAHLSNFGTFASPERALVFDINDFDETLRGPWEWDLKRFAASLSVVGRENDYNTSQRKAIVEGAVGEYRLHMRSLAAMHELDVWYATSAVNRKRLRERGLSEDLNRAVQRKMSKARSRDHSASAVKLTRLVDGRHRLVSDPPFVVPIAELYAPEELKVYEQRIDSLLTAYRETLGERRSLMDRFEYVEAARKVVGVGSVGLRAWIVLFYGRDEDDPLFLQVKEAHASVLEPYVGKSGYEQSGERVVRGQRLMQSTSDILLGWLQSTGPDGQLRDYYVRQLHDWKASVAVEEADPDQMSVYAGACARALARAHARTGDRIGIAAYLGNGPVFDRAMAEFAETYADQNERDYAALCEAASRGDVVTATASNADTAS